MGSGQATVIQVLIFITLLTMLSYVILSILRPWIELDTSSIIVTKVVQWIEETNGVIGLRFNQCVLVKFFTNGTVLVRTSKGIEIAKVKRKLLLQSSARGFVIYIVSNETHAYVTSDIKRKS